ncbi:hypothetical protein D5S17_05345 [Pseudonocardiaceae bacterium YIM PH 21723]|nr:hypothetical protein D5S17_05345 [Pseudonocardiaceae bacterium YIM PH 21723]
MAGEAQLMRESLEDGWRALTRIEESIRLADTKAGFVLAGTGILGSLAVRVLPADSRWSGHPWQAGFALAGLVLVCAAGLVALWVFSPQRTPWPPGSILYFEHIAERYHSPAAFGADLLPVLDDPERLLRELADQIWAISGISRRKHHRVRLAIAGLGVALLLTGVAAVLSRT